MSRIQKYLCSQTADTRYIVDMCMRRRGVGQGAVEDERDQGCKTAFAIIAWCKKRQS